MNAKKTLSMTLAAAMAAGLLAGCGGSSSTAASSTSTSTESKAESTAASTEATTDAAGKVYYLNFKPEQDEAWQNLAKKYTEETGVPVTVVTAASGQYETTLMSEMAKSDAPTLFQVNGPVGLANWKDYCYDLSGTKIAGDLTSDTYALKDGDQMLGIGYVIESYGLITNKTLLEKAGYTVENGKLTAAPEGAKMQYEVQIPADGTGNHPAFMMVTEAKKALAEIGMDIVVTDLSDATALWDGIRARQVDMWCAAWSATPDPDMYQVYYADVADFNGDMGNGFNPQGGPDQGNSSYMYCVADEELDNMIMEARKSLDQSYRKTLYKECLDIVADWAVEIPVYQRQNAIIFSTERVKMETVLPDITTFYGWLNGIENMELN